MLFLGLYRDWVLYFPTEDVGAQGWRKRNAMIWFSRERREGIKTLRRNGKDPNFYHARYFLYCCNAHITEKNGCNPVCTVSRSKIEVGTRWSLHRLGGALLDFFGSRIHMHRESDGDLPVWKANFLGQALIGLEPLAVRYSSNWLIFKSGSFF